MIKYNRIEQNGGMSLWGASMFIQGKVVFYLLFLRVYWNHSGLSCWKHWSVFFGLLDCRITVEKIHSRWKKAHQLLLPRPWHPNDACCWVLSAAARKYLFRRLITVHDLTAFRHRPAQRAKREAVAAPRGNPEPYFSSRPELMSAFWCKRHAERGTEWLMSRPSVE